MSLYEVSIAMMGLSKNWQNAHRFLTACKTYQGLVGIYLVVIVLLHCAALTSKSKLEISFDDLFGDVQSQCLTTS